MSMIPANADSEKQERTIKEDLEPRLEEAESGKSVVFFVDAAHFVIAHFLGILWSCTRLLIKAPASRKRFNVLGALNAITHELTTVTNDTHINAQFCDLLWHISHLNIPANPHPKKKLTPSCPASAQTRLGRSPLPHA